MVIYGMAEGNRLPHIIPRTLLILSFSLPNLMSRIRLGLFDKISASRKLSVNYAKRQPTSNRNSVASNNRNFIA